MSLALGLDCSGETYSLGLFGPQGVSLEASGFQPRKALREMPGALSYLLKTAGATQRDLSVVGLTQGPGSFTGVRLGVTVAKTVAMVADCPVCPWDTLQLLARQALPEPSRGVAAVALDARRGELYCGLFKAQADGWETLLPTGVRRPEEFKAQLEQTESLQHLVGAAFAVYPELWPADRPVARLLSREQSAPSGLVIARLSHQHPASWIASNELFPVYHRQADIQVSHPI